MNNQDYQQDYDHSKSPQIADQQYRYFKKFQLDLEFIQLLGDPGYVIYLVQQGYLRQQQFIKYLNYLNYFRSPEYLLFIKYPEGLKYLELLQQPEFVRFIEMSSFQKNQFGLSRFTRQLKLQGFLHSKYMWAQKQA